MDIDEVRKVARLARLDLPDDDLAVMARQLSAIIGYVDQLKELDTEGVEPLAHPLPVQNVFRADELRPSLPVEEALRTPRPAPAISSLSPPSSIRRTTKAIRNAELGMRKSWSPRSEFRIPSSEFERSSESCHDRTHCR